MTDLPLRHKPIATPNASTVTAKLVLGRSRLPH